MTFPKQKQQQSKQFLKWAKQQGGLCCLCLRLSGQEIASCELHHYGEKGMGQKGSDYCVARLCKKHHGQYQGMRRLAFFREDLVTVLEAIEADNIALLESYVVFLEGKF